MARHHPLSGETMRNLSIAARLALASLALVGLPQVAAADPADQSMNARETASFTAALSAMGYAPEVPDKAHPTWIYITAANEKILTMQGGCEQGKKCQYIVLYRFFTDKANLDFNLLNKLNADYDLLRIWINGDGKVAYSMGIMAEGMTRSHFRASVDQFVAAQASLAKDLLEAKAIVADPAPAKP
ncbi:MAG: YbjN domain-containing protein [Proteobacteria bacterium]|nr:YbjN domain-containing protein [Pseudomonadota bacterium]